MEKKAVSLAFACLLLFSSLWIRLNVHVSASPDVIWVPDDYTTIQAAINAANAGDIIMVRNRTYYENVIVNKTVKLIGEDFPTINGISGGLWGHPTFKVKANNITISEFIIQLPYSSPKEYDIGIELISNGNNVSGNVIRNYSCGIIISNSNIISNNIIEYNYAAIGGGSSRSGRGNLILNNLVSFNGGGIRILSSNSLINNTIVRNSDGIFLDCVYGGNITLNGNNLNKNKLSLTVHGVKLSDFINDIDPSNAINGNPIYYWINEHNKTVPADAGYVALINSTNITAKSLNLEKNGQGILIAYSTNCTIQNCNISNNWIAINLQVSNNITIHHNNFVNNTFIGDPFGPPMPANTWDDGYPSGGNYWSDYTGEDLDGDGIGDTPYVVDANNMDSYPLMSPYEYWSDPTPGDVNKDTKVDHKDLSQLTASYGSTPEKPNWNPNADTNDDGKINYEDLFTLAANYGKKWEYP